MYRIGEFSKMVKLTVKTLRFYEECGILMPEYIDPFTSYRYYGLQQLYPVQKIVALRQAGFGIEQIKSILSGKNVTDMLEEKYAELNDTITKTQKKLVRLSTIQKFYSEEQTMNYQAIIKDLPEYIVYYKEFVAKGFEDYGTVIPAIGAEVTQANPTLKCIDPNYCFVEYLDGEYKEHDFSVAYAEAVESYGVETEGIKFKTLPPVKVVSVMHKGAYENISKAYAYALSWLSDNGYKVDGNFRERYIDGCWNKDSEEDYLTEIQIPISKD